MTWQTKLMDVEYEALERGRKEGMQQGVTKGKIEIARNLLKINLPLDQIAKATGLSKEEVKHLVP